MSISLKVNNLKVDVQHFTFNGGEEQVKINQSALPRGSIGEIVVQANIKSSTDAMTLVVLTDAIHRLAGINKTTKFVLKMPYVPYARQDRVMTSGEALSIKAFSTLINSLNYDEVHIDDPHSDVTYSVLNNTIIHHQHELFQEYMNISSVNFHPEKADVVIAPDAGARKKAQKIADVLGKTLIEAGKSRNVETGEITGSVIYGDVKDKVCIIVDDIIDGGGTFVKLSEVLKREGAKYVILYATHGIFSRGKELNYIDEVHAFHDWTINFN